MVDKFKAEADENKLSVNEDMAENKFLDADTKGKLAAVLNYAGFGFGDRITTMQLFIKESYEYDKNGNRIKTVTKNGTINYNYDEDKSLIENRVLTEEERSEHVELLKAITAWKHSKKIKI